MLTMTPTAATALANARTENGSPSTYGVRFFATPPSAAEKASIQFSFVEFPESDDTVVEQGGLKAYVAPEVHEMVGDAVVDVVTVGQQSELVLRPSSGGSAVQ